MVHNVLIPLRIRWETMLLSLKMHFSLLGISKRNIWEWRKIDIRKILGGYWLFGGMWELMEKEAPVTLVSALGKPLDEWVWTSKTPGSICLIVKIMNVTETAWGKELKRRDRRTSPSLRIPAFKMWGGARIQARKPKGAGEVAWFSSLREVLCVCPACSEWAQPREKRKLFAAEALLTAALIHLPWWTASPVWYLVFF